MASVVLALVALVYAVHAKQLPTQCADDTMTLWMRNSDGKNPCELVQDVMRVCDSSYELGFLPRSYSCDNAPGSSRAPCCCGSPTFALMSACWSCQYNITFDVVTTTFTGFEKDCQTLPDPITSYDSNVESSIRALSPPGWALVEPLAGKWDMGGAWKNATPYPTAAPPVPTGYPLQVKSTGISKGALAGAIVGAILGSKILFMAIGYMFYRWWRKQPGHQRPDDDDDDEKGYAHRVLGEPRHNLRGRIPGRSRRGSRAHVDLDEDSASPRSSRWLGVPSYLHPTSFHSHSSQTESIPGRPAPDPQHEPAEGGVTPFETRRSNVESEKARARRQSLRVTNDPQAQSGGSGVAVENESVVPRPQPALLAHALSSSPGSPPAQSSPRLPTVPSRTHSHAHSVGSSSGRYQEDDAGVSLVIEHEDGASPGSNEVRCVPPAYVDYRSGYSRADKIPRLERRESDRGGSGNGTSESATYVGSAGPTRAPSVKEEKEVEDADAPGDDATTSEDAPREETTDASREDATEGSPMDEARDRTLSADSEGASTIKPGSTNGEGTSGPLERASTTDLATLTATNTAANRSAGPGSPSSTRPTPATHSSAPADVTLAEPENPPSPPAESAWSWGRTLGMFGIGLPPATPAKD